MVELKKCRKCGYQFLSRGKKCPNCGTVVNGRLRLLKITILALLVIVVFERGISFLNDQYFKPDSKKSVEISAEEYHYQRLSSLVKNQRYGQAVKEIEWIKKHDRLDYNIVSIFMKNISNRLIEKVSKIPVEKTEENYTIYELLCRLEPENDHYQNKKSFYQNRLNN